MCIPITTQFRLNLFSYAASSPFKGIDNFRLSCTPKNGNEKKILFTVKAERRAQAKSPG